MKELETIIEKTPFEVKVLLRETIYDKEAKARDPSSSEEKFIAALDYHLTCDRIGRESVSSHRYNFVDLVCYCLNVGEKLQDTKSMSFKEAFESNVSKKNG